MIPLLHPPSVRQHSAPNRLVCLAIAFASGLLMGCTLAPINIWILAWVALAPLWVLLKRVQNVSGWLLLAACGMAWGMGYHGLGLVWILDLHPLTWMGIPWLASVAIAFFVWIVVTLWGSILVAIWAVGVVLLERWWLRRQSTLPIWVSLLSGTALWCVLEGIWSSGSLWWTSLSLTQSPHNLAILHLGQLSGPNAVTGAIVVVNGAWAEAWLHQNRVVDPGTHTHVRFYGLPIALCLMLHMIGLGLYSQPLVSTAELALNIGIIQGNVPTRIKLFEDGLRRAVTGYTNGYRTLADQGVDAVLTPEGALPYYWLGVDPVRDPLHQVIQEKGVSLWLGTPALQHGKVTQSLVTVAGTGEILSRYDKIKLVPLGEYIPFEPILGQLIQRLSPLSDSMVSGSANQHFETPFGRAIAGICFDSAFSTVFRRQAAAGGQFILTASNNDPYGAAMMAQHHAQDVMRAIESDRWAVRATNTGLSGVVDPHGKTIWISGFRTYETHVATVYRRQSQTLYVRWDDWLTPVLLGGVLMSMVLR